MEGLQAYIPEDMLVNIFLRLEVKSLLRIRCVCKTWYRIVSSTSFIESNISCNTNKLLYIFDTHRDSYSLVGRKGSGDHKKYYYTAEQFGINLRKHHSGAKVYGSCNGLLCVSHVRLGVDSTVYLLNPMIQRAKNIGKIPSEVHEPAERCGDLCLGYFDGDYKVIKMVGACVGVYSLRKNGWKILSCDSKDISFEGLSTNPSSKFVNGVAYFVKYIAGIVCFDLHDETMRGIKFPEKFNPASWPWNYSFKLEKCGESVALMEINGDGYVVKWGLRSCGGAESLAWEKECSIALEKVARLIYPVGFNYNGEYIVRFARQGRAYLTTGGAPRQTAGWNEYYLCDLRKSELKECGDLPEDLRAVDYLAGNLVLLNEQTLCPVVDSEATCTKTTFVVCKRRPPKKKREKKKNIVQKEQNGMQGRTKRKLEG